MKKLIVLFIMSLAVMVYATSEHKIYKGTYSASVTTDSAGDSTTSSGSFGSFRTEGYSTVQAEITIQNATPSYAGLGNLDSVWIQIYTFSDLSKSLVLLDSTSDAGLPYTYSYSLHSNVGDTLLRNNIAVYYQVYDSLGDTALTVNYPIQYNIKLK